MKFPVVERKYMGGKLSIKVWYQEPSMKCTVIYGLSSIDLPRHLDEVRGRLRGIMDEDATEKWYRTIEKEVNDMLREYQLEHDTGSLLAEQFTFPTSLTIRNGVRGQIDTFSVQNGQVHIMSGATPTYVGPMLHSGPIDYVDRHVPYIEYLSDEEYQERRERGELESGCVYCVLN